MIKLRQLHVTKVIIIRQHYLTVFIVNLAHSYFLT